MTKKDLSKSSSSSFSFLGRQDVSREYFNVVSSTIRNLRKTYRDKGSKVHRSKDQHLCKLSAVETFWGSNCSVSCCANVDIDVQNA